MEPRDSAKSESASANAFIRFFRPVGQVGIPLTCLLLAPSGRRNPLT
jgi:hypothetical protein